MQLNQYFICLLLKGPGWTAEATPELEQLQAEHLAHNLQLLDSGAALAIGPITDDGELRGFSILRTATLAEAQALAEADPAVRAGRFVVRLHPWMVPAGKLAEPWSASHQR